MEQINALIEKAKSDKELMDKLDALGEKDAGNDEIITLAKEYGFTVTAEEIEKIKSEGSTTGEIKEEELEAVAGGWSENRYDPKTCKNITRKKYDCEGFLNWRWCDHFRKEYISGELEHEKSWYSCVKGAFPRYKGNRKGEPI